MHDAHALHHGCARSTLGRLSFPMHTRSAPWAYVAPWVNVIWALGEHGGPWRPHNVYTLCPKARASQYVLLGYTHLGAQARAP